MRALQERNDTLEASQTGNIFAIAGEDKAYLFHILSVSFDWTFKSIIVKQFTDTAFTYSIIIEDYTMI